MDKSKILVCCHKETPRIKDEIFTPILLGSAYADGALKESYQGDLWDNMGNNIAQLHPYCAELSAIYWAWQNYEQLGNPDYIGLFHYRRFFNFCKPLGDADLWKCAFFDFSPTTRDRFGWNEDAIEKFCSGYDLVLPPQEDILDPKDWKTPATLEIHYKHSHYPEDFDAAIRLVKEKYPGYAASVDRACSAYSGHFCNMFVMTKEKFFDYAQWLFSIILPLKETLQIEGKKYHGANSAQMRVLGFLGERLFNIWIDYQKNVCGANIRETERLTGYLTEEDRHHFQKTYGQAEYRKAMVQSAPKKDLPKGEEGDDLIVYPPRSKATPAVSLLLPVYNVGTYLRECIESLVHQTLQDMEFVFVYDVSQDDSFDILMEYYQQDDRICVVENKKRGGMAVARNIGMRFVRGKYMAFMDSDDICDETMYEKLYVKAEKLGADITTCSVWGFFDTIENKYLHRQLEWFRDSDKLLDINQRPQQLMEPAAWCKLFRTEYVRSLDFFQFRPGVVSWEDVPAMTFAFIQTPRLATVQEALYFYRQRESGNLSNCMTRRYVDEYISGAKLQAEILRKYGPFEWEFMSYIEEFKCLYAEWMLSKLARKDIPYFFHHVGCLFRLKDRAYLKRLFDLYPKRCMFYYVMLSRSSLLFFGGKKLFSAGRKLKQFIKKVFGIRREGVYRVFHIGPFHFKKYCPAYSDQTIEWLEGSVRNAEFQREKKENEVTALQGEVEALRAESGRLESEKTALTEEKGRLQSEKTALESEKTALTEEKGRLEAEKTALTKERDGLQSKTDALGETVQKLQEEKQILGSQNEELRSQDESMRKTVEDYRTEFSGFYHVVWTTGWIEVWRKYYCEHYKSIEEKKERLKTGLDEESKEMIDLLCYRNFQLLPMQADADLFRYDHEHIYTEAERAGLEEPLDEEPFRKKYVIPADMYLEVPVFKFRCGIPYFSEQTIKQIAGRAVIDGGAFWGDSALIIQEYGPQKIFAFEPQLDSFGMLQKTIVDNHLEGTVCAIKKGLGSTSESRQLYSNSMLSGSNIMHVVPNPCDTEIVNTIDIVSIDSFVREHDLDVGLIKLDIEGNELATIHGAEETIRRCRPLLCISIYHHPQDFFEIKPFLEQLGLGYHFMIRKLVFHDLVTEVSLLGYCDEGGVS